MESFKNLFQFDTELHEKLLHKRKERIKSLKGKMDLERTLSDRIADFLTESFGTMGFLIFNGLWYLIWMVINTGFIPGIEPFDPFPFGLLTMIVSLEAIFLSIIVLISQNRAANIAELREEVDLQVNVISEQEITKVIFMLDRIQEKMGIQVDNDEELEKMKKTVDIDSLQSRVKNEISRGEDGMDFKEEDEV